MGACDFSTTALGKTAEDAFRKAREEAAWEHGHGGYTGTIAEKGDFVQFGLKPRTDPYKVRDAIAGASYALANERAERGGEEPWYGDHAADRQALKWLRERVVPKPAGTPNPRGWGYSRRPVGTAEAMIDAWDDKWGPAVCVEVTGTRATKIKERRGRKGTHDKVFLFFGMASE